MTTIHVKASREYDVIIERGILDRAGDEIRRVNARGSTAAIVAGERVAALYGARLAASLERAGYRVVSFVYPGGEQYKTLETYARLMDFLSREHFSRTDLVAALGGGVTGDLAGFAAATYQRGTAFAQIPTTLLAAVDSSVGGKTAVDLPSGKNQAGCFYQPCAVLCDPDTLSTLPEAEFANGCAEVVKYGVLGDAELFAALERGGVHPQLERVIARCVEMKRDIVEEDEFDTGRRLLLNLGHSVGHAIEKCSGFAVPHGSAVAIGTVVIMRAAAARGICPASALERTAALLKKCVLPTETEYTADELSRAMLSDKKIAGGRLRLVVPEDIGSCRIVPAAADELPGWLRDGGIA